MKFCLRAVFLFASLLSVHSSFATQTVYMVLEQDPQGHVSHNAVDLSSIGDGIDPLLQFILLNEPTHYRTAQVLWEASETPIPWVRDEEERDYRFVEHVVLPTGSKIEYRIYDFRTESEIVALRHTRSAESQDYYIDSSLIDTLDNGQYNLVARLIVPHRPVQTISQRLDVVDLTPEPPQFQILVPVPDAIEGERLEPGDGWAGKQAVPGQVGDSTEPVIAHWNVVPEQQVADGFTVGVIAHHLDGIDYVEISANNGPWVRINKPTINPRTKCQEYWTTLDLRGHAGKVELRAIAIPNSGKPVLVKPLGSSYGQQDLTLYPNNVGAVIELDAGEHNLKSRSLPKTGWLVVRPKPGVSREDVILVGESRNWGNGRLKLENLTIRLPYGGGGLMGQYNVVDKAQIGNHVWLDGCRIIGSPMGNKDKQDTWWIAHQWETATYTDCRISHISKVFFAFRKNKNLVRNCYIHDIYEDVFNTGGLIVNVTIEDVDRQPQIDAQKLSKDQRPHPDLWQSRTFQNTILQDVNATKNINAQGLFIQGGRVENVAVVRTNIRTASPWRAFEPQVPITNWLIQDSNLDGSSSFSRASVANGQRLVIKDSKFGSAAPFLFNGWDSKGVHIFPRPGID